MCNWQPIETAPDAKGWRPRRLILAYFSGSHCVWVQDGYRDPKTGNWMHAKDYFLKPTHWMPLPELPTLTI